MAYFAEDDTRDLWSSCPSEILAKCFMAQLDHTDNCGAGCVCVSWNEIFCTCVTEIAIQQNPLNEALLSSTYLSQFSDLHKVDLARGADWQTQNDVWLNGPSTPRYTWSSEESTRWTATLQSLPPSCRHLTLDGFLPQDHNILTALSQRSEFGNLQQLHIRGCHEPWVDLAHFRHLQRLEVLSLTGQSISSVVKVQGTFTDLPAGLLHLKLRYSEKVASPDREGFDLTGLSHLDHLDYLDLSYSPANFGAASVVADLQSLTTLVLTNSVATLDDCCLQFTAALSTATRLQDLSLRCFTFDDDRCVLKLDWLLMSLPSLQMLDVTSCPHISLVPADCRKLHLHSFSFHYSQLMNVEVNQFNNFTRPSQTDECSVVKSMLQVEGQFPHFGYQHWVQNLPLVAVTHLTIFDAHKWPVALFFDGKGATLPNLQFLDVSFASLVSSDMDGISFTAESNLRELYIAGTSCTSVDLAACTSLTSLGIIHRGHEMPSVALPISLQRLYLHNVLRRGSNANLGSLSNMQSLKLGGQAATKGAMKELPELPSSLVELDLWDGLVRGLNNMSLLTNLKKLTMPLPPSREQLQDIKRLRQLRHINVTTHQGQILFKRLFAEA